MNISLFFRNFPNFIKDVFSNFGFSDVLDILLLSFLFYWVYSFLRDRRAANLLVGIFVLLFGWLIAAFLDMTATAYLLDHIFSVGFLALVVIFRDEIRTALEKLGDRPWRGIRRLGDDKNVDETYAMISALCDAVGDMRKVDAVTRESTGALIVIERTTKLGDIVESGTVLDAVPSSTAFQAIFYKGAPMHDGAVIIRNNRIAAAGCMLPNARDNGIGQEFGTRHRAALGMSDASDAVVVVLSEETGIISLAYEGKMYRNLSIKGLQIALAQHLISKKDKKKKTQNQQEE